MSAETTEEVVVEEDKSLPEPEPELESTVNEPVLTLDNPEPESTDTAAPLPSLETEDPESTVKEPVLTPDDPSEVFVLTESELPAPVASEDPDVPSAEPAPS